MEFYSFVHRRRIEVAAENLRKRRVPVNGAERYAIFGTQTVDGKATKVSKFVSKAAFDAAPYPEGVA
jgi:hypothetical protein